MTIRDAEQPNASEGPDPDNVAFAEPRAPPAQIGRRATSRAFASSSISGRRSVSPAVDVGCTEQELRPDEDGLHRSCSPLHAEAPIVRSSPSSMNHRAGGSHGGGAT